MTTTIDPVTLGRRVELLYRNVLLGQVFSIINATGLVWVAISLVDNPAVYLWCLAAVAIALYRLRQATRYAADDETARNDNAPYWRRCVLHGALGASIIWSAGAVLLMTQGDTHLQLFTAFVMAGMVAGAVPILAADRTIFRSYAFPIVLTVAVCAIGTDTLHIIFSVMSVFFLLAVTRSADFFHGTLQETLRLEREKDGLIGNLETAHAAAERADRAKTEFLANISHELRTPMNGVLGLAELLSLEDLTEDQKSLLDPLRDSANQLMQQIEHLIELSALEAGHVKCQPAPFAVNELLDGLLSAYHKAMEAKGLTLLHRADPRLPEVLVGDLAHLQKIFQHLVGNAIKFTDKGSVNITAELLEQTAESVNVQFSIIDTGPGITPEKIQAISGLFTQVDGASNRRFGGMGVGLPIARKLIELMGGKLTIDSQPGSGSTFRFVLPFTLPEPETDGY